MQSWEFLAEYPGLRDDLMPDLKRRGAKIAVKEGTADKALTGAADNEMVAINRQIPPPGSTTTGASGLTVTATRHGAGWAGRRPGGGAGVGRRCSRP